MTRSRAVLIFMASLAVVSACGERVSDPKRVGGVQGQDTITFDLNRYEQPYDSIPSTVISNALLLGRPTRIVVKDTLLFVIEAAGEPYVHVLDARTGALVRSLGRRGGGPGEFGEVPSFVPSSTVSERLWFLEGFSQEIEGLDLKQLTFTRHNEREGSTLRLEPRGVYSLIATRDGFVGSRRDSTGAFLLTKYNQRGLGGEVLARVAIDDGRASPQVLLTAYQHLLCAGPTDDQVALVYTFAGKAQIVDLVSQVTRDVQVPVGFVPTLGRNPVTRDVGFKNGEPTVRRGYSDCATTAEGIVLLFRGVLRGKLSAPPPTSPSFLHVFDWQGRLTRVIRLDHYAESISVSPGGDMLYTTSADSEDQPVVRVTRLTPMGNPL